MADPVGSIHPTYYRVPDFAGRSPEVAMRWADQHDMYWEIPRLPRLDESTAPNLFAAYVVTAQQPTAGDVLPSAGGLLTLTVKPRR